MQRAELFIEPENVSRMIAGYGDKWQARIGRHNPLCNAFLPASGEYRDDLTGIPDGLRAQGEAFVRGLGGAGFKDSIGVIVETRIAGKETGGVPVVADAEEEDIKYGYGSAEG